MTGGYIYLERKIQDNPDWQRRPFSVGQAWVDLLILASYKDHSLSTEGARPIEVEIKRGQVLTSQVKLKERWGWSRKRVVRQLEGWKRRQQIDYQTTQHYTLITILNYGYYQTRNATTKSPANDSTKAATKEQQTPTINKGKEKEKKLQHKEDVVEVEDFLDEAEDWAYKRATVRPGISPTQFRDSVERTIAAVGLGDVWGHFSSETNAIRFLTWCKEARGG